MHHASYYAELTGNQIRCDLCPHQCLLTEGKSGQCKVRVVRNGKLVSENYGRLSAIATDPIEKKPLYHFFPGEKILSIGSVGCNMHCKNCQNENISQCIGIGPDQLSIYSAKDIAGKAIKDPAGLVAFTYNEPTVYYEFMYDVAKILDGKEIKCVMVTNGYIMPDPLQDIIPLISGFNVDLKFFQEKEYRKMTGAGLKPVLNTLEQVKRSGKHLEITFLIIPGINDHPEEFKKMIGYIHKNLGKEQILHLSRYFPRHKMNLPPTAIQNMLELKALAQEKLDFVYLGNAGPETDTNTWCPSCGNLLIQRNYYITTIVGIKDNTCVKCGKVIHGKFREQ